MDKGVVARIDTLIQERGMTREMASRAAGLGRDAIRDLARAKTQRPTLRKLEALAPVLETTVEWLAYGTDPRDGLATATVPEASGDMPIIGEVAAGRWQEIEPGGLHDARHSRVSVPPDPRFPAEQQYLLRVSGNSMDEKMPDGFLIHCVAVQAFGRAPKHGDYVVVEQRRAGHYIETTVKKLIERDNALVLRAESTAPKWRDYEMVFPRAQMSADGMTYTRDLVPADPESGSVPIGAHEDSEVTITAVVIRAVNELLA